jgi:hypothetical protein
VTALFLSAGGPLLLTALLGAASAAVRVAG